MKNPAFEESLRIFFFESRTRLTILSVLTILLLFLLLFLPRGSLSQYMRAQRGPSVYSVIIISTFLIMTIFTIRYSSERTEGHAPYKMRRWFQYTTLSPYQLFFGKAGFGLLHTLMLTLLPLPILIIAAGRAGIGLSNLLYSALTLFLFLCVIRMYGFFLLSLLEGLRWMLEVPLWTSIALFLLFSPRYIPNFHPVTLLLRIESSSNPGSVFIPIILVTSICALFFGGLTLIRLIFLSRKYRSGNG